MTAARFGPWRTPRNLSADAAGSIHDDDTAQELGLRGGTVAGNIHLNQFVPSCVDTFGSDWHAHGCLSVWFERPTLDLEQVRVGIADVDGAAIVHMEQADGQRTAVGTAHVGEPTTPTELAGRDRRDVDVSSLRILRRLGPGTTFAPRERVANGDKQRALLARDLITEPRPEYDGADAIACPLIVVDLLTGIEADMWPLVGTAVGMYGAIEIAHLGRPVELDQAYDVRGEVVAVSASPRTEVLWYDSIAALDGEDVVRMRMVSRLLKASSPHYADDD